MLKNAVSDYHKLANPLSPTDTGAAGFQINHNQFSCWLGLLSWPVTFEGDVVAPTGRPAPCSEPALRHSRTHAGFVSAAPGHVCARAEDKSELCALVIAARALQGACNNNCKTLLVWRPTPDCRKAVNMLLRKCYGSPQLHVFELFTHTQTSSPAIITAATFLFTHKHTCVLLFNLIY